MTFSENPPTTYSTATSAKPSNSKDYRLNRDNETTGFIQVEPPPWEYDGTFTTPQVTVWPPSPDSTYERIRQLYEFLNMAGKSPWVRQAVVIKEIARLLNLPAEVIIDGDALGNG
jgi:hypothetical protein